MRKGVILNSTDIYSLVRNNFAREGIGWSGFVRTNLEGRELSLELTNHVTEGTHKDCVTWTFDTINFRSAVQLFVSTTNYFFKEELDFNKLSFPHLDLQQKIFLEVRVSNPHPK